MQLPTCHHAELLGREWLGFDDAGQALIRFQAQVAFTNRHGTIQGGFLAAMLDSATGVCALAKLSPDLTVVTSSLDTRFHGAAAHSGKEIGYGAAEPTASDLSSVIASAAKQSRIPPRKDSGLLRCARNDDVEKACAPEHHQRVYARLRRAMAASLRRCAAEPGLGTGIVGLAESPPHLKSALRAHFDPSPHPPSPEGGLRRTRAGRGEGTTTIPGRPDRPRGSPSGTGTSDHRPRRRRRGRR
ncbi:PaaI family thioesterase [Bradyrhizobium sp. DASA03076]|uniref:PaaI family thioesterase n=1 Tax=Bradyrhizobium sp. BLXBL-03 TaxID=3395916 RepID=UPI003F72FE6D